MREAIVNPDTTPGPGDILIKVAIAGTNPKDWKDPTWSGKASNSGDDAAGIIARLGAGVFGFFVGQRVVAMHAMWTPGATFAEYALAPQHLTFPIPDTVSFAEAVYTSAVALFHSLELPATWDHAGHRATEDRKQKHPLIIYGVSSALGAFGIKLAKAASIHPVIAPDLGDQFVDYTAYPSETDLVGALKDAIRKSSAEGLICHAYDCIWEPRTAAVLSKAIARDPDVSGRQPRVTIGFEDLDATEVDKRVQLVLADVSLVQEKNRGGKLFDLVWGQAFTCGLADGWLTAHPYEIDQEGFEGLSSALNGLKDGTIRGRKTLIRVDRSL
ncbi:hypothetical protein BJY04DRAFT_211967 [Aspergillus karnatakaensis]|uniref:uncharacterized protein n=1 Tax=Aspergillus karnatakaensis TaxID=1810916 RepID=UPI003CCD8310